MRHFHGKWYKIMQIAHCLWKEEEVFHRRAGGRACARKLFGITARTAARRRRSDATALSGEARFQKR
jgi:hypothetical protein